MDVASTSFPNCRIRSADFDIIFCSSAVPQLRLRSSDRKSSAASVLTSLLCTQEDLVRLLGSQQNLARLEHDMTRKQQFGNVPMWQAGHTHLVME